MEEMDQGSQQKNLLPCHRKKNLTRRIYIKKRIIKIWAECARFDSTSQRLTEQARMIIKKGWFSDIEIQKKLYQQLYQQ